MDEAGIGFSCVSGAEALNAGLFISPGRGRHPSRVIESHELVFVKSGVLGISEAGCGYRLGSGESLLLEAGLRHEGTLDYAKGLQFYWIHFRLRSQSSGEALSLPKSARLKRPERMVELFRFFLDEQESGALRRPRADALMELILLETLERGESSSAPASASDERLAGKAEQLMKARSHEASFGSSALAKELKCNPDYLNRVFKRLRGVTVTAALQRLRVNAAAQLLLEGSCNVEEAAELSGFSDRCYLRRVFRKLKGMTPKDYRKLHLRMHINTR
jgi:AraC-like DNA-binding protein